MATRVSADSIKEKNRRATEKDARRLGGTFTNKAGKTVGISTSHQANKNAAVLASSGSPEAKALNTTLPSLDASVKSTNQEMNPPTNTSSAPLSSSRSMISEQTPEQKKKTSVVSQTINQFTSGFVNTPKDGDLTTAQEIGSATGILTLGIGGFLGKIGKGKTVVQESLALGSTLSKTDATTSAGRIAVNSKTVQQTTSWLGKVGAQLGKPKIVAATVAASIVGAIGSYPFAGFIKEEALQSLELGTSKAYEYNDMQGVQEALALREEILDVTLWEHIKQAVPYVNILDQLDEYYKAASIKLAIDKRHFADLQVQAQNKETESDKWNRIYAEQDARKEQMRQEDEAYYEAIRLQQERAKQEGRRADAEYYAQVFAERSAREKKLREEETAFWNAYYANIDKKKSSTASTKQSYDPPSKLNFGLI